MTVNSVYFNKKIRKKRAVPRKGLTKRNGAYGFRSWFN